jgi:hypothetical protein
VDPKTLTGQRVARLRRRCATPVTGALLAGALVAALPAAASAAATPIPSSLTTAPAPVTIGPGELANLEAGALGLSGQRLIEVIAHLPGEEGSEAELTPLVETELATPGTTVGELLEAVEHALGGTETPTSLTKALTESATTPEALASLLADLSRSLDGQQLTGLEQIFERLLTGLNPAELESLESILGEDGSLSELASDLAAGLPSGSSITALEALLGDLGGLAATTGTTLAEAVGTPLETLAGDLGASSKSLSESTGVSTTLPSKEIFYVLTSTGEEGLTIGVTPPGSTSVSTGGTTPPASPTTSTTTIEAAPAPVAATATPAAKIAKITIVRHRIKKHVLTLVVKAPAAGKVTISAAKLKTAHRSVAKARKITFRIRLTTAGAASLHRRDTHHKRLTVRVKAKFKPKSGASSSATAKVRFS